MADQINLKTELAQVDAQIKAHEVSIEILVEKKKRIVGEIEDCIQGQSDTTRFLLQEQQRQEALRAKSMREVTAGAVHVATRADLSPKR
ncbi:MAG: hypothetical protein NVS1B6_16840 [Steroidobacteraceae bacterium]